MIHVEHARLPRPEDFDEAAAEHLRRRTATLEKSKRKIGARAFAGLPGRHPGARATLREIFSSKCVYCETPIRSRRELVIDHFRPKSGARGDQDKADDWWYPEAYWWLG